MADVGCDPPRTMDNAQEEFYFWVGHEGFMLKISWTYTYEIADPSALGFMTRYMTQRPPDVWVWNTGVWETIHWTAPLAGIPVMRRGGGEYVDSNLRGFNFSGLAIYWRGICNKRYNAPLFDSLLVPHLTTLPGHKVVNAYALSLGRVEDSTWDGFHHDRSAEKHYIAKGIFKAKEDVHPNIGTLNFLIRAATFQTIKSFFIT
jgi:hypothetical protein